MGRKRSAAAAALFGLAEEDVGGPVVPLVRSADFIELAHVLRMPSWKVMLKIYLPTILPYFFSGARLAFGFGWRVSLVAETLGSSSGVGYRLRQAADLIQTDQVFAWTLTLVVMMAALEMGVLRPLEDHLFRWKKEAENQ